LFLLETASIPPPPRAARRKHLGLMPVRAPLCHLRACAASVRNLGLRTVSGVPFHHLLSSRGFVDSRHKSSCYYKRGWNPAPSDIYLNKAKHSVNIGLIFIAGEGDDSLLPRVINFEPFISTGARGQEFSPRLHRLCLYKPFTSPLPTVVNLRRRTCGISSLISPQSLIKSQSFRTIHHEEICKKRLS
jgi:hypothetical protein